VPTDGTRLPIDRSGDFGASPLLRQLLGKQGALRVGTLHQFGTRAHVCSGSFASILACPRHVRFAPDSDRLADIAACPVDANSCHMHRSKRDFYSITSSASSKNASEIERPSSFAVLRLITSSYLSASCSGRLPAFSPLRTLSM